MATQKRMQKGKLIKQYIGEGLFPLGFTYEGRKGDTWVFERKVGKVRQMIKLYEYRFENNRISFDLDTNAGNTMMQAIDIKGIEFNSDVLGFWKYEDKEEFIELLIKIREILLTKGMSALEELSIVNEGYPTNKMYHTLYIEHAQLADKFIKENDIKDTEFTQENIDAWFEIIERKTSRLIKGELVDQDAVLIEIASFLGEVLIKNKGGKWKHSVTEFFEFYTIKDVNAKGTQGIDILGLLCAGYEEDNDINWLKEEYELFLH